MSGPGREVESTGSLRASLRRFDRAIERVLDGDGQPWWRRLAVCFVAAFAVFTITELLRTHEGALPGFVTSWLPDEDAARDRFFRLASAGDLFGAQAPPIVLVEIDEAAFGAWGRPVPLRRAPLADLIRRAALGSPLAIVLDVDFGPRTDPADEEPLRDALAAFAADQAGRPRPMPLLLARSVHRAPGRGGAGRIDASTFDDLVGRNGIAWAAVSYYAGADGVVREMPLFEAGCLGGARAPTLLTSVQAAIGARLGLAEDEEARETVRTMPCDRDDAEARDAALPPSGHILYHLVPGRAEHTTTVVEAGGRRLSVPVLERIPALSLAAAPLDGLRARFAGQVVIIGASHAASGDWQLTPLGTMPGPLVIANAVRSYAARGTIRPLPLWPRLLALALVTVVAWTALEGARAILMRFPHYNPGLLKLGLLPLLAGLLTALDLWVLGLGMWSDLFIPQVAAVMAFTGEEYRSLRGRIDDLRRESARLFATLRGRGRPEEGKRDEVQGLGPSGGQRHAGDADGDV